MTARLRISAFALLAGGVFVITWRFFQTPDSAHGQWQYQGRSIESWFFSGRTNFLLEQTRLSSQTVLLRSGRNAVPFLLEKLTQPHGSPVWYERFYRHWPHVVAARFRFPLTDEEIRTAAIMDLYAIRTHLTEKDFEAISDCVLQPTRGAVRAQLLSLLQERNPKAYRSLCLKLLDDPDSLVRVEAALPLSEDAIMHDPGEPRLAAILLPAFENTPAVIAAASSQQTQKPLKAAVPPSAAFFRTRIYGDPAQELHRRIRIALIRLAPYLTPEQKARFEAADRAGAALQKW